AATAPVTVYEMSDFQCPFCKRHVDETFPTLEKEYIATGKVRWIFINLPLSSIHPNAVAAAEFAMCAARAGKFWPAHDALYRSEGTHAGSPRPAVPRIPDRGRGALLARAGARARRDGRGLPGPRGVARPAGRDQAAAADARAEARASRAVRARGPDRGAALPP